MTTIDDLPPCEVSWFAALCDDDYEYLGLPDPSLSSSWEHCRDIALDAERGGFDNLLLPSGYSLGIDPVAFAGGIAPLLDRLRLLVAVRCGEIWVPQLARQLATLDQMLRGRLTVNIISSDLPGETRSSRERYQRTRETMIALRTLLNGKGLRATGELVQLEVEPPRATTTSGRCPPLYFGGLSPEARAVAAEAADVYLMWPDTPSAIAEIIADLRAQASSHRRRLRFGLRIHVIVRETQREAHSAARRLISQLDDEVGEAIRRRSLDSASVGVQRQAELRDLADAEGYVDEFLWTGIGRARQRLRGGDRR